MLAVVLECLYTLKMARFLLPTPMAGRLMEVVIPTEAVPEKLLILALL